MRKISLIVFLSSLLLLIISCGEKEPQNPKPNTNTTTQMSPDVHKVNVIEKIDASNYSYLKVDENNKDYWIAVPKMEVKPGETVLYSKFMEMKNFKSETLNRTFESILFVDDATKTDNNQTLASPHSNISAPKNENIKIEPLKDGYSIAKLYDKKSDLVNKIVKVKGMVVKVNENIMGTNWIHIQDGTGTANTHDLLVTSQTSVKVGQTIIAEGKVIVDKDFGAGYFYPILLENSKITVE
jgi:hypothetical protein